MKPQKLLLILLLMVVVLCFFMITRVTAQIPEFKPYGFIKGDMVSCSKGVLSFGQPNLAAAQIANGDDRSALGFTAQHTRFGMKGDTGEDVKVGGQLELDFYVGSFDANARPRIRLAYAWMKKNNFEARFGQQWDIFSPNNATTNNTNGNMWYAGNLGFRRGQIQLIYKMPVEGLNPMLQLSVGEGAKENTGMGIDNFSGLPMFQGRASAKLMDKHTVGVYFAYASFEPDTDIDNDEYNSTGFGMDFNCPFNKFLALKGEFNMGTNLNNANLFTSAGHGAKDDDRKNLGIWFNAISKFSENVHGVLGFGLDKNQTDNLVPGTIEQNMVIYGDLIIPVGKAFSIALEIANINTEIYEGDDHSSMIIDLAGKITF